MGANHEPVKGLELAGKFNLPRGIAAPRLQDRDNLRKQFDRLRRDLDQHQTLQRYDRFTRQAYDMVLSGKACPQQANVEEVARETVRCLRRVVPGAVPGIVFLSGGQSNESATANLNAMNALDGFHPWQLSFSYGRALQEPPLKAWRGNAANIQRAQQAFHHRAKLNGAARYGKYVEAMEKQLIGAEA